ncbi:MAG TPA: hypothetical protein VIH47_09315 [Solirubrobacterales bacterium]
MGELQFAQELPSSLHWKLESGSLDLNPKLAVVAVVVELGLLVMEVFGGVVSVGGVVTGGDAAGDDAGDIANASVGEGDVAAGDACDGVGVGCERWPWPLRRRWVVTRTLGETPNRRPGFAACSLALPLECASAKPTPTVAITSTAREATNVRRRCGIRLVPGNLGLPLDRRPTIDSSLAFMSVRAIIAGQMSATPLDLAKTL